MFQLNMISSLLIFLGKQQQQNLTIFDFLKMFPEVILLSSLSQSLKSQVGIHYVLFFKFGE